MALGPRMLVAAIALLMSFGLAARGDDEWGPPYWTPPGKLVEKLEKQLKSKENHLHMPTAPGDRSEAMAKYARYYSGVTYNGRKGVIGEMISPSDFPELEASAGAHIVSRGDLPLVADGGCNVIWLLYRAKAGKILWTRCNPVH